MTPHEEKRKLDAAEAWMKNEKGKPRVAQAHPKAACERCVYGSGKHAKWCSVETVRVTMVNLEEAVDRYESDSVILGLADLRKETRLPARYRYPHK